MLLDDKILLLYSFLFFLFFSFPTENPQFGCWFIWKAPWTDQRSEMVFCKTTRELCYRHKDIYSKQLNDFHCDDMIVNLANNKFLFIFCHHFFPFWRIQDNVFINDSSSVIVFSVILMLRVWLSFTRLSMFFKGSELLKTHNILTAM